MTYNKLGMLLCSLSWTPAEKC